jgi:hypothetical protein
MGHYTCHGAKSLSCFYSKLYERKKVASGLREVVLSLKELDYPFQIRYSFVNTNKGIIAAGNKYPDILKPVKITNVKCQTPAYLCAQHRFSPHRQQEIKKHCPYQGGMEILPNANVAKPTYGCKPSVKRSRSIVPSLPWHDRKIHWKSQTDSSCIYCPRYIS